MTGFARFLRATRQNTGFARANGAALPARSDAGGNHAAGLATMHVDGPLKPSAAAPLIA